MASIDIVMMATPEIDYRPVHTWTMTDEVQYIEPKKRVY